MEEHTIVGAGRSAAVLVVESGARPGEEHPLSPGETRIGRDDAADVVVQDPEISRIHARITRQGESYFVEDMGSTNGTYVNGAQIIGRQALNNGDKIGVGQTVLVFRAIAAPTYRTAEPMAQSPADYPPTMELPGVQVPQEQPRKSGVLKYTLLGVGCLTIVCVIPVLIMAILAFAAPDVLQGIFDSLGLPLEITCNAVYGLLIA